MDKQQGLRLLLTWGDTEVALEAEHTLTMGRDSSVDLAVDLPFTSRHHARIERDKHYFVLTDCSANGTYVQSEDLKVTHVHRQQVRLWGNGWISLGHGLADGHAVRFRHE